MNRDLEYARICQTEVSEDFITGMRDRMVMSYYKYGLLSNAYPHKVDAVGSMMERMRLYAETGNTEFLIDAGNFAMIEFMFPRHPKAFFQPTDDEASPGRRDVKKGLLDKRNNEEIGTNPNSKTVKFRE